MSEAIVERHYHISAYADEVPVHEPTLAAAAAFLLTGATNVTDGEPDWPGPGPLAQDGDTIELMVLEMYADRTATRQADGSWLFSPPVPEDAGLFAIRYGPDMGWNAETMFESPATFAEELKDIIETDDEVITDIAVGRQVEVKATFHLIDGRPELEVQS